MGGTNNADFRTGMVRRRFHQGVSIMRRVSHMCARERRVTSLQTPQNGWNNSREPRASSCIIQSLKLLINQSTLGKKKQTLENNCKKTEAGGIEKRSAIQSTEGPQISLGDRHPIGNARVFEVLVPVEREDDKLEQGQRSGFGFVWRCNRSSDFAP